MSWSFPIARLFGINVYVHATFFLLLAFVVFQQYRATQDWDVVLFETLFVVLIFTIIVLHELGHALMARRFGVQTRDITLLPIGGVARLERIPENPYQEFAIAVAGPAVNVVLAILCFFVVVARGNLSEVFREGLFTPDLIGRLLFVNVGLVVFNMIPAFPMDGGRVLRSVLAMGMPHVQATRIAATIGKFMAMLFGLAGLFVPGAFMLLLIALFIWVGAASEAQAVETRSNLSGASVRHAMISEFRSVQPGDSLETIAGHVLAGFQQDFPVAEDGQVVGIITRGDLLKAMAQVGRQGLVADVMQRNFVTARPDEPLTDALQKLQECDCHSMPVLDDGQLVGMVTSENIGEFLMLRSAARQARQAD
jgi:Zn-dependent protease